MEQYIKKYAIVAEIKRLIDCCYKICAGDLDFLQKSYPEHYYSIEAYKEILSFIDTLEVKDVNLEKELRDFVVGDIDDYDMGLAKHFFELGMRVNNPITAADRGIAEEIITSLKQVENDYYLDQTKEIEWVRNKVKEEEPISEEQVKEDTMTIRKEWFDHCKKSWYNEGYIDGEYNRDRQFENSVSEDFEEALAKEWKGYNDRGAATVDALEANKQELAFAKGFYRGSKWQEEKDNICYEEIFEEGAKWKAEQFEKERLKQCDTLTKEQAKIESDFVVNFIKKNNCTPTFIDAIEYGMQVQKEQMMAKAINAECFGFQDAALFSFRLPSDNYLVGSKVKVIVIKED